MNDLEMNYIKNDVEATQEAFQETFKIDNDKKADWAVQQIKESESERDRLITLAQDQIAELQDRIKELTNRCENETKYLKSCLAQYFETVKAKETKTQKSYKLLSGTLVLKKPSEKIEHDDKALLEWLADTEYIKIERSVDWAEYKKKLTVQDNLVIDTETGEVVECCKVVPTPGSFDIKY